MFQSTIAIPPSVINNFSSLASYIAEKYKICLVFEGFPQEPTPSKEKKINRTTTCTLKQSLEIISDLYDMTVLSGEDNRDIYKDMFVFQKKYSSVNDFPCVVY